MPTLSRADNSLLGRWWWTVDRCTLGAIGALLGFGYIMILASSPSVATRIGDPRYLLIYKQVFFLVSAACVVVCVSMLTPRQVKRLAIAGCIIAIMLTAATLVIGVEIKGARRWIEFPGMAVQPSEFMKPCFAVVTAWLLAEAKRTPRFPGTLIALAIFAGIIMLLKEQPDVGMAAVVISVFLCQLYLAGMNLFLVLAGLGMMGGAGFLAYVIFPHVQARVHSFLHPTKNDAYQATTALEAFGNGGFFGRGPGEGRVKDILPDAHADFVFAVMGEEFGMLVCLVVIAVFTFIVLRVLLKLLKEPDLFTVLACAGLVAGFGLEAFVNMASTLALIPTKGMTLPFISYGGSSAIAVALGLGMLLALTRRRHHGDAP
ncbi:MAG TPA: FtsW/RodA/SpoVE family cell cycle protein [Acetobacteraceae bacterium]|jgi:cell division protein FtsW|nr:FtsW/RodA/SpoVE family cell cycle protein [Acetobacteraceae bacterium]